MSQPGQRNQLTILEGTLAKFSSLLLELFDCPLVDTTALVDQVASGGGLAGVDVSDDCWLDGGNGQKTIPSVPIRQQIGLPTTLTWVFSFPIFKLLISVG